MGQNVVSVVPLEGELHSQDYTTPEIKVKPISTTMEENKQTTDHRDKEANEEKPICRICHCSSEDIETSYQTEKQPPVHINGKSDWSKFDINDPFFLISPCFCTGSLQYVHHKCLQKWIRSSSHKYCELCKYNFKLKIKSKPIYKWESLNMSRSERQKLLFQLAFNFISIIFVFWSIYVIAERATYELVGQIGWKFWLKMLIVTVGFICGILFIFFQLKLYVTTIVRWKQYNQIVIIENVNNSDLPLAKQTVNSSLSTSVDLSSCEHK